MIRAPKESPMRHSIRSRFQSRPRGQRGVATLLIALVILVILTIIVLSSANLGLFEQKTATNEYRERLAEQSAEYALNLGGEYLKANVAKISTNAAGSWLNAASQHWFPCSAVPASSTKHPCTAERNGTRRGKLYYYSNDLAAHTGDTPAELTAMDLFATANGTAGTAALGNVGGAGAFPATAQVYALLCRIDSSSGLSSDNRCALSPTQGRRVAVTLIATSSLTGENASATVKETWGTLSSASFSAATPLVAAGSVNIVGTFTVVDSPNAGGYGIPAAVWSPQDAGGNGSWQTCPMEDYLGSYSLAQLTQTPGCAEVHPSSCQCNTELLSTGGATDGIDMLDKDGNSGQPDITFFPGSSDFSSQAQRDATRMDYRLCTAVTSDCPTVGACPTSHPDCLTDDNLFEFIFGKDVTNGDTTVVQTNCTGIQAAFDPGGTNPGDCEVKALQDLNFKPISDCSVLDANSSGLYYVTGTCDLKTAATVVGSPDHPVILVANNDTTFGHVDDFFGMVFIRSAPSSGVLNGATISGNASGKFFGSIVVEGSASHLNGTMDLVYMDTSAGNPNDPLPETTRFARLPNSWLDNMTGF